jgi:hypothetical protein
LFGDNRENNRFELDDLVLKCAPAPPNHGDGVVHHIRAEAEKDNEHFDGKTTE